MGSLKFQMAWTTKEEEAIGIVVQHMRVMDDGSKEDLCDLYTCLIFPRQNHTWDDVKWTSLWGITFVTMWSHEHLLWNLCLAMIREHMGIGPMKYCIVNNWMPEFESNLLLLINYLPHQKMCFFPPWSHLEEPFSRSPWREIGDKICEQTLCFRSPIIRTLYYSQQFQIFLNTGIYGHSVLF